MKSIFFLVIAVFYIEIAFAQKVIQNPNFSATTAPELVITKIVLTETETILSFLYENTSGLEFSVPSKETYIQNSKGGEKLMVKSADGVEMDKGLKVPENGKAEYVLHFPLVGKSAETIDFQDPGWKIFDIELVNKGVKNIIPEQLLGNWFRTDGSNEFEFGFYEKAVVYNCEVWKNMFIKQTKKEYKLTISNDEYSETFTIKPIKDKLLIAKGNEKPELFSRSKTENPSYNIPDDEEFKLPLFEEGIAYYKGYIRGYHPKMEKTGMAYLDNIITGNQYPNTISINPDGTFSAEISMVNPQGAYVKMFSMNEYIWFEPGKTTFQVYDLTGAGKKNKIPMFMGETSKINSDLNEMSFIRYFNYPEAEKKVGESTPYQYKDYVFQIMEMELNALNDFTEKNKIGTKARQIKLMSIKYTAYANILSYNIYKQNIAFKIARENNSPVKFNKPLIPEKSHFDFIKPAELNNPLSVISGQSFEILLNRLFYEDCITPNLSLNQIKMKDILAQFKQNNIALTENEIQKTEKIFNCETILCEEERMKSDTAFWNQFNKKYKTKIREFKINKANTILETSITKGLKEYFGFNEGLVMDIHFAQKKSQKMEKDMQPLSDLEASEVNQKIKNDFIKNYLLVSSNKMAESNKQKLEAINSKSPVAKETPKATPDRIFDAIIEKYKGKVIYVDFWATWCGPCRSGIERIKPLKEELKDNDIVFLYISAPTSPEETWKLMIPDIKGEHFRVSEDDWNYLSSKFKISGIPHYALVDKKGNILNPHLSSMENSTLKNLLLEELQK